jgi:RNA polymerase sigma factor (sigma-70 family)
MGNLWGLLKDARGGDKGAEKRLFEFLYVRFYQVAKRRIRGTEDIKDIVLEACITVFEKNKQAKTIENPEAWTCKILRNIIGNYLQNEKTRSNRFIPNYDLENIAAKYAPNPGYDIKDLKDRLLCCLRKILAINRRYARILVLKYQGYKTDEIARRLNISRDNVYTTLNRGRGMLKFCVETGKAR